MIALLESYAYEGLFVAMLLDTIGLPVPGEVFLFGAGFLVSTGRLEPIPAILVATLGAVLGDSITYWLGRRAGVAGERRLVALYCAWTSCTLGSAHCAERAEGLVRRLRGWVVVVAKFIAGARVFVPPVAGASGWSVQRFLLFDAAGSLLWTAVVLGVGALVGHEWGTTARGLQRVHDVLPVALMGFFAVYLAWKVAWRRRYGAPRVLSRLAAEPDAEGQDPAQRQEEMLAS